MNNNPRPQLSQAMGVCYSGQSLIPPKAHPWQIRCPDRHCNVKRVNTPTGKPTRAQGTTPHHSDKCWALFMILMDLENEFRDLWRGTSPEPATQFFTGIRDGWSQLRTIVDLRCLELGAFTSLRAVPCNMVENKTLKRTSNSNKNTTAPRR